MDSTTKTELHPTLAVTAGNQQCSNCGAALSADQRYCVECGERSGDARLPVMDKLVRQPPPPAPAAPKRRGPQITGSTTVIAGIATLILAMGVGVLIGRSSNNGSSKNAGVQVVTVAGERRRHDGRRRRRRDAAPPPRPAARSPRRRASRAATPASRAPARSSSRRRPS